MMMIGLIWNARGVGNSRAFRELRFDCRKTPFFNFICEIKLYQSHYQLWKSPLVWNDPLDINICSYSHGHIDCLVSHEQHTWRFTGFYGNPIPHLQSQSLALLLRLYKMSEFQHLPWLIGGHFNEILYDGEKKGGSMHSLSQISAFRDVLNSCNLQDLSCLGDQFTWCNRRK